MKQILLIAFIALLLSGYINIVAQDNVKNYIPHDYSIIPPSPEVASLMKYIDFPISHFTGQPDINIHIYTVKEGGISIPISISYNGNGLKVHEDAGIIGSGWTLQAGATISRTIYGLPDEMNINNKFIRGIFNLKDFDIALRNKVMNKIGGEYEPYNYDANPYSIENYTLCSDFEEGRVDMASDVFQFYGMGMSGTFMYNPNSTNHFKEMVLSSGNPIAISPIITGSSNLPNEYTITDNIGTKYSFIACDSVRHEYQWASFGLNATRDSMRFVSSWNLNRIENIYGDNITLKYERKGYRMLLTGESQSMDYCITDTELMKEINKSHTESSYTHYYPKTVSQIISKSTIVKFKYDAKFNVLEEVTIHRNDANLTMIKRIKLNHNYITIGNKQRLFLTSIDEIPLTGTKICLYKFDYNLSNVSANNFYFAQDHWGYYNGITNQSLLVKHTNSQVQNPYGKWADRSIDTYCTKIGSLTSITYPTGGKTEFEWEQNDYSHIGSGGGVYHEYNDTTFYNYNLRGTELNERTLVELNITTERSSLKIDLSKYLEPLRGTGELFGWEYNTNHSMMTYDVTDYPRVEISKLQSNGFYKRVGDLIYLDNAGSNGSNAIRYIPVTIGTYRIELKSPRNFNGADQSLFNFFDLTPENYGEGYGYIPIKFSTIKVIKTTKKQWGGLRIAKIQSYSDNGSINKNYTYRNESEGPGYSSGNIAVEPWYEYSYYYGSLGPLGNNSFMEIIPQVYCTSSAGLYSTPVSSPKIEYPFVSESYDGSNFSNIKIKYRYTSYRTAADELDAMFYGMIPGGSRMWTSMNHQRGILTNKTFIDQNNKAYKEIDYSHNILEGGSPTFTSSLVTIADFHSLNKIPRMWKDYTVCKYKLIPYNKTLEYEITKEYDNTNTEFNDTVSYSYFTNQYTSKTYYSLVKSKTTSNSKDNIVITYYSYYRNNNQPIDLKETEVSVINGRIVSAKKMIYDNNNHKLIAIYSAPANLAVQSNFKFGADFSASTALLNAINLPEYNYRYDSDGNLAEIRYNGEVLASYLWGYKGTYPIAEIKAIPYDELVNRLPNGYKPAQLLDATNLSSEALNNNIRNNLAEYDVTTMTYHWLIGVSAATDSRGITTHFTFDDFGRLSDVKDYNQYFIRKYDYNYKGQN